MILMGSFILFRIVLPKYKLIISEVPFPDLVYALNMMIRTEIELWEKDIFSNRQSITNSNFDNYYYEITNHIIANISPMFFKSMEKYMTETAIISMIGRSVKEYLVSKINGTI